MRRGHGRRAFGVLRRTAVASAALALAIALGGCNTTGNPSASVGSQSASVAFETIDGAPPEVFRKLVQGLNNEAQARRVAVTARGDTAAFRVRGYLAMQTRKGRHTVSWLWDVYDAEQQRALRISGEETMKGKHADAWTAVDDATVHQIARRSMEQLATFLNASAAAPVERTASVSYADYSPEAFGIFRNAPHADPVNGQDVESPGDATGLIAGTVPLPPRRPTTVSSAAPALVLAAARR